MKEDVTVVILAGGRDFGRCPIATRLPRLLWPLVGRPILEYHVKWLARQGVRRVVVSSHADTPLDGYGVDVAIPAGIRVHFLAEPMPRGTAGCLSDARRVAADGPLIAMEGGVAWLPDVWGLVRRHRECGAELTVFTAEAGTSVTSARPAGIYVCEPEALNLVSERGYQDMKEQLIPALLRAKRTVVAARAENVIFGSRDTAGYLDLLAEALAGPEKFGIDLRRCGHPDKDVWVADSAEVCATARLVGPVVVMDGARVADEAVVMGPAVIGRGARVEWRAVVDESAVWDGAFVGAGACLVGSVVDENCRVAAEAHVANRGLSSGYSVARAQNAGADASAAAGEPWERFRGREDSGRGGKGVVTSNRAGRDAGDGAKRTSIPVYAVWAAAAVAALSWAYSGVISELWRIWMTNDNYSSGVLVPPLAAYVIYAGRAKLAGAEVRPSIVLGPIVVLAGFVLRFLGTLLFLGSVERFSIIVVLTGAVLTVLGVEMTKRLKWALLFLVLMLPWPNSVHAAVSLPLQNWATGSAVFLLELLGWVVVREGNILNLGDTTVAVAEACSGLRMLTAFMVVSALIALLLNRAWWEKAVILVSSVPIAVACNTIRLAVTAMAFSGNYGAQVNQWFHDFGGIAMMPLALAVLAAETWLMDRLMPAAEKDSARVARTDGGKSAS